MPTCRGHGEKRGSAECQTSRADRGATSKGQRPFIVSSTTTVVRMTALQNRLAGTFHLVSLETRRSDGVVSHPFGEQVVGSFMFDRAGNFAVQLVGERAMAMFGTYVVDES